VALVKKRCCAKVTTTASALAPFVPSGLKKYLKSKPFDMPVVAARKRPQIGTVTAAFVVGVLSQKAGKDGHFLARAVLFPVLREREKKLYLRRVNPRIHGLVVRSSQSLMCRNAI
jgi:hypothetical protein